MPANFNIDSYFNKDAQFKKVTFADGGKVVEAELNELQDIVNFRIARVLSLVFGSRPLYLGTYGVTSGKLNISNEYVSIDGEIVFIPSTNYTVAIGDAIYLNKIETTLTHVDTIKKYGEIGGTTNLTNNMLDSRVGEETTRRVQVQYQLTKTNTGSGVFQKLCDIIDGGSAIPAVQKLTFSDTHILAEARAIANTTQVAKLTDDGGNAKTASGDLNNLKTVGFYYCGASVTANKPVSGTGHVIVIQSASEHTQIYKDFTTKQTFVRTFSGGGWENWIELETTTGAQSKADQAETDAINWAKGFGLGDVAKDISSTDLNNLDVTGFYRGSNLTNAPVSNTWFYVLHLKHSSVYKQQIAIRFGTSNNATHTRTLDNGTWSAWSQLETTTGAQAKVDTLKKVTLTIQDTSDPTAYKALEVARTASSIVKKAVVDVTTAGDARLVNYDTTNSTEKSYVILKNDGAYEKVGTGAEQRLSTQDWVKSFGLGDVAPSVDWNAVTKSGFYQGITNGPNGTSIFFGIHTQHTTNFATQIVSRDGQTYTRSQEAGTWGSWKFLADRDWVKSLGIGGLARATSADLNTLVESGFYNVTGTPANRPVSANGHLIVTVASSTYSTQTYVTHGTTNVYVRSNNNGTWTSWEKMASESWTDAYFSRPFSKGKYYTGTVGGGTDLGWKSLFRIATIDRSGNSTATSTGSYYDSGTVMGYLYDKNSNYNHMPIERHKFQFTLHGWNGTARVDTPKLLIPNGMSDIVRVVKRGINDYELQIRSDGNNIEISFELYEVSGNGTSTYSFQNLTAYSGTDTVVKNYTTFDSIVDGEHFSDLRGKPTTLSGYGITDALPIGGGTLTGKITTPNGVMGVRLGDDVEIGDVNTANMLGIQGVQDATTGGLVFGSGKDTNLYRGGANILKTDDTFNAVAGLQLNGAGVATENWVKGFGLGDVTKDISNTDLNSLDVTGFYRGSTLTNAPVSGAIWFYVINMKHTANYKTQIAIRLDASVQQTYQRVNNNGTWTPWVEFETTSGAQLKVTAPTATVNFNTNTASRLVIPVGTDKWAT